MLELVKPHACRILGHHWDYHDLARCVRLCFRCGRTERER